MEHGTATGQKEARLSIRASEPQKKLLAQAARARNLNTSQFVLEASLDAAHAALADQTEFRLTGEQWEAFCRSLDAPPRLVPELRRLFNEPEAFGG